MYAFDWWKTSGKDVRKKRSHPQQNVSMESCDGKYVPPSSGQKTHSGVVGVAALRAQRTATDGKMRTHKMKAKEENVTMTTNAQPLKR